MATLVLQFAGAAVGGIIGGPLGAVIGRAAGAIAGGFIDAELFGAPAEKAEGPRLQDLRVMGSTEGAAIPRVWGRMRVAGQVIWATNFEEVISTRTEGGSKGSGSSPRPKSPNISTSPISRWRSPKGRSPGSDGCGRTARNSTSRR